MLWCRTAPLPFGLSAADARLYAHGGRELIEIFRRVKNAGVTTSIDMSLPDPNSESGHVPWRQVLERLLPLIDVAPLNAEEAMFMLDRERFDRLKRAAGSVIRWTRTRQTTSSGSRENYCDWGLELPP